MAATPFLYVATAQRATNVTHAVSGNFTSPDEKNLILAKSTRLELHTVTPEGLMPVFDVGLHGRVAALEIFRMPQESKDWVFFLTERFQFSVLSFDAEKEELVTIAKGDVKDRMGQPVERGPIVSVDPASRCIVLHLYDGLLKVIPMEGGFGANSFNIRIPELIVLDIVMIHNDASPAIGLLFEAASGERFVKFAAVNTHGRSLDRVGNVCRVDNDAHRLIPFRRHRGVLVVSANSVAFVEEHSEDPVHAPLLDITAAAHECLREDETAWLLGDHFGTIHQLNLTRNDEGLVTSISVENVGDVSIPSTLNYLEHGFVFVGSCLGDSQLVRLLDAPASAGDGTTAPSRIEVVDSFANLGPIMDFDLMDVDQQGQSQVITCSGAYKEGSLRVVRNGIGMEEQAVVEMPGIKGLWSLRRGTHEEHDQLLVQSFAHETRILGIDEEDAMTDMEVPGFKEDAHTVLCANLRDPNDGPDVLLQVTSSECRIVNAQAWMLISSWSPGKDARITLASAYGGQVLLALAGGEVIYLELNGMELAEVRRRSMPHDVSCVCVRPFATRTAQREAPMEETSTGDDETAGAGELPAKALFAAIGLWTDITVRLVSLPSLEETSQASLGGEIQPRSVLLITLEQTHYLLAALGDGNLLSFLVDPSTGVVHRKKRISLGTQPVSLTPFEANGACHVFAACDRPAVVSCQRGNLTFASVNMPGVTVVSSFHTEAFPNCLALANASDLIIGEMDEIQKLHVQTVPLGMEQPRRIVYHRGSRCFVVATIGAPDAAEEGEHAPDVAYLRLVDDSTFEVRQEERYPMGHLTLEATEEVTSLALIPLGGEDCVAVGTAYVLPDEEEPRRGRILLFSIATSRATGSGAAASSAMGDDEAEADDAEAGGSGGGRTCQWVRRGAHDVAGAVLAMQPFKGMIAANVNAATCLYTIQPAVEDDDAAESKEVHLRQCCGYIGNLFALYLQARGPTLVVGDIMRSITVLEYDEEKKSLREIARDPSSTWMTSLAAIADDLYIGSDNHLNLFTLQRRMDALSDEERGRLDHKGVFHLGDSVNMIRAGSLVRLPEELLSAMSASDPPKAGIGSGPGADAAAGAGDGGEGVIVSAEGRAMAKPEVIFGTVNGAIGVILSLSESMYHFLKRLERAMAECLPSVGGLSHEVWRSWYSDDETFELFPTVTSEGYIDGDLIESLLELDRERIETVVTSLNAQESQPEATAFPTGKGSGPVTVETVLAAVEELSQLH